MSNPCPTHMCYTQILEDNRIDLNGYFLSRLQISRNTVARVRLSESGDTLIITKGCEGTPLTVDNDGAVSFSQKQRDALALKPHDYMRLELFDERQELHVKKKEPGCITCHRTDTEFRGPNMLQCNFCELVSFYLSGPGGTSTETRKTHMIDAMSRIILPQQHLDHFKYTSGCAVHLTLTIEGAAIMITRADEGILIDNDGAISIPWEYLQSVGVAPGDSLEVCCGDDFILLVTPETEEERRSAISRLEDYQLNCYTKLDNDGFLKLPGDYCLVLRLVPLPSSVRQVLTSNKAAVVISRSTNKNYRLTENREIFFAYPRELGVASGDYLHLHCDQDAKTITITKKKPGCITCHAVDVSFTHDDLKCDDCYAHFKLEWEQEKKRHNRAKEESKRRRTTWAKGL